MIDFEKWEAYILAAFAGVVSFFAWLMRNHLKRIEAIEEKLETKADKDDILHALASLQTDIREMRSEQGEITRWIAKSKPCKD